MSEAPAPVFARVIETPPGSPWDQARAALLYAREGAPMSDHLAIDVQRLGRWKRGTAGRFAAAYQRLDKGCFDGRRLVEVDGRAVVFSFRTAEQRRSITRRRVLDAMLAAGAAALVALAFVRAVEMRDMSRTLGAQRDQAAEAVARHERREARIDRRMAELARKDLLGRSGFVVARDLAWAGSNRASGVTVQSVTWRKDGVVIVAAGAAAPLVPETGVAPSVPGTWIAKPPQVVVGAAPRRGPSVVFRPPARGGRDAAR